MPDNSFLAAAPAAGEAEAAAEYLQGRGEEVETLLTELVNRLLFAQAEDPIAFLISALQQKARESPAAKAVWSDISEIGTEASRAPAPSNETGATEWKVSSWLKVGGVVEPIAAALLRPLGDNPPQHAQLEFMRRIGRDRAKVRQLLDVSLLDELADAVCESATELQDGQGRSKAEGLSQKFAEDTFTLSFGSLDTFFNGLEGSLGSPNPNLRQAMETEHVRGEDSKTWFQTSNYGVRTRSDIEWYYVVDPQRGLAECRETSWPGEQQNLSTSQRRSYRDLSASLEQPPKKNEPPPLSDFTDKLAEKNDALKGVGSNPLLLEELIGGRLYTGPLYFKYNLVLRALAEHAQPFMRTSFEETCMGNRYVTTLHVLNSCIVKLSKLATVQPVFRGLAKGGLPREFFQPDEKGICGGVESAFMSTTANREVALAYAHGHTGAGGAPRGGILLELEQGMCNRGAQLRWLSQYPHEDEVLFAPLTGIETRDTRIDGSCVVVQMKLSVNLTSPTIEQVVAKMQASHKSLAGSLRDSLRYHGAPSVCLAPLDTVLKKSVTRGRAFFNEAPHFKEATNEALESYETALALLAEESTWDGLALSSKSAQARGEGRRLAPALLPSPVRRKSDAKHGAPKLVDPFELRMRAAALLQRQPAEQAVVVLARPVTPSSPGGSRWPRAALRTPEGPASLLTGSPPLWCAVCSRAKLPMPTRVFAPRCAREERPDLAARILTMAATRFPQPDARAELVVYEVSGARKMGKQLAEADKALAAARQAAQQAVGAPAEEGVNVAERRLAEAEAACAETHAAVEAQRRALVAASRLLESGDARRVPWPATLIALCARGSGGDTGVLTRLAKQHGMPANVVTAQPFTNDCTVKARKSNRLLAAAYEGDDAEMRVALQDLQAAAAEESDAEREAAGHTPVVDRAAENGVTPLMLASRAAVPAAVQLLLDAGARLTLKSASGCTALSLAVELNLPGAPEVVRLLTAAGADPNVAEVNEAAAEGTKQERNAALHKAANNDATGDVVGALLDAKADPNLAKSGGWTPLIIAAQNGHIASVQRLLDAGADVEGATLGSGTTAFIDACFQGRLEVAKLLIDKVKDIDRADSGGDTALCVASSEGHAELVRMLLAAGADPNAANREGKAPLDRAMKKFKAGKKHYEAIVETLTAAGAREALAGGGS